MLSITILSENDKPKVILRYSSVGEKNKKSTPYLFKNTPKWLVCGPNQRVALKKKSIRI